ncbi:JAB1/Mov34/MPN/PAD-1 ubiquitin protease-domain-containing protein [Gorgonomyces haynaldii]|nr:JAB1/Mov34/MPN/PAD-1 ubiquitin protease-domain-containing protein [Gorgonomyces haynaldii]
MQTDQAFKRFQTENNIQDEIYFHNAEEHDRQVKEKPWLKDPNYFKKVHISAVALIKMTMHARSGGEIEVMGLMQGRISGDTMIVMDAFALPVEGTETRVNAQAQGYEYMVQYMTQIEKVGRLENVIGWYHSHPGYGCWLSGIDVGTQMLNQQYQEPFCAVVIDPKRTISAGKVELGAFRTYPEGHKATTQSEYQSIPLDKIEDFGVHANQYYQLEVSYFKSSLDTLLLDQLWKKYWINTLSSSNLLTSWEYISNQIKDLSQKIEKHDTTMARDIKSSFPSLKPGEQGPITKLAQDGSKIASEAIHGLLSQVLKELLFNKSQ